jgi:hypothetical protein
MMWWNLSCYGRTDDGFSITPVSSKNSSCVHTRFLVVMASVLLILLVFCVVPLCVFTFWFPCCDFRIKAMFSSSVPPVVGGPMSYLHYLCLFVHSGVQIILCCDFDLNFFVLCTLCAQYLWIVIFLFPLRYSLTFILGKCQLNQGGNFYCWKTYE